jgi:LmbE family N-acetylglucosaminyl deacetylase
MIGSLRARLWRTAASLRKFVQGASIDNLTVAVCEPGKSRVVVLAPHMDDEVLGCGGTIARHVRAQSEVSVVFLTDGRHGGAVALRKSEARRAADVLGVRTIHFLDAEDSRLRHDSLVAGRLRATLEQERPEIVYLPFFLESHPDHRATNSVLFAATRGSTLRFECRGYEVWTPLFPNCIVRIDETLHLKRQAMECYASQLAVRDYLHCNLGLNAYRTMSLAAGTAGQYAEVFHALPLRDYRRLHDALFR